MRNFLWEHNGNASSTFHLVNWTLACADKEMGGLGILKPRAMNLVLLDKGCWLFGFEKTQLRYMLIVEKYGCISSYCIPKKYYIS